MRMACRCWWTRRMALTLAQRQACRPAHCHRGLTAPSTPLTRCRDAEDLFFRGVLGNHGRRGFCSSDCMRCWTACTELGGMAGCYVSELRQPALPTLLPHCVQVLSAMTQAAMLHVCGPLVSHDRIARALQTLQASMGAELVCPHCR